ncbi:hypothetical protein F4801DRAFT_5778 [Xylaria longipes]|nr:hypothetical protein F4801DRAFT_5778 [Xylaria longipes]
MDNGSLYITISEPSTRMFVLSQLRQKTAISPLQVHLASELPSLAALSNRWISRCAQTHRECQNMATPTSSDDAMPTRLIEVGSPSQPPRLVESCWLQVAPYLTLSYCWGTSGKNLKTTKSNLHSMKKGIEWGCIPKTIQDAMTFARALGVRYLWVDALCIVQHESPGDQGSDWDTEAVRMG